MISDNEMVYILSELAQEIESADPIDWGNLTISESDAYDLMANEIYEKYKETENIDGERLVLLATIVKLTVENFTLNLKLMNVANNGKPH
jgi:hypothetical protein